MFVKATVVLTILLAVRPVWAVVQVDGAAVLKDTTSHSVGININYLMDDDHNRNAARPTVAALKDMGVRVMRYPGGEKSDSYFWSRAPYEAAHPTYVANTAIYPAVNADLTYKDDPLDFDEYMAIVKETRAEPYLVVAYGPLGGYKPGTTLDTLIQNAVEWVRYANITKKYGVKYWEIGNENWNSGIAPQQVAEAVVKFSSAMKAVDPTIQIGASGNNDAWWGTFLPAAAAAVDFVVVSEYPNWQWLSYAYYPAHPGVDLTGTLRAAIRAIDSYASPADRQRLFAVTSESNSADWSAGGWPMTNNLGHALAAFDGIGQALLQPKARLVMFWTTRWWSTPAAKDIWSSLDDANNITASGRAIAIWGQFLGDRLVSAVSDDNMVPVFASTSPAASRLAVFLINKDSKAHDVTLRVDRTNSPAAGIVWTLSGTGSEDAHPTWTETAQVTLENNEAPLSLPATSLTVVAFDQPDPSTGNGGSDAVGGKGETPTGGNAAAGTGGESGGGGGNNGAAGLTSGAGNTTNGGLAGAMSGGQAGMPKRRAMASRSSCAFVAPLAGRGHQHTALAVGCFSFLLLRRLRCGASARRLAHGVSSVPRRAWPRTV